MNPADLSQMQSGDRSEVTRSHFRILVLSILILLGIGALTLLSLIGRSASRFDFTSDIATTAAVVAAVVTMFASFRSIGEYRQGWIYTALGCIAWGIGFVISSGNPPVTAVFDIGIYLISIAAFVLAALAFGRANGIESYQLAHFVDLLPMILALSIVNWTLEIGPMVESIGELSIDLAESLVHGLGTVTILTVVISGLSSGAASGRGWSRRIVLASVALLTVTASLWNGRSELQFDISTTTYERMSALSFAMVAGSALWSAINGGRQSGTADQASRRRMTVRADHYLQFGALASLILLSAIIRLVDESASYAELMADIGALSILLFIVTRQSLVIRGERLLQTHIGELSEQLDSLVSQVGRDPLTGLLNHRAVHERLDLELVGGRAAGESVAIALIDVDNFKSINDTLGHQAGDHVLRAVSTILVSACRGTDVAARYAGDEFMLILPGLDERHAGSACERIAAEVRRLNNDLHLGGGVLVTLSIGVAVTHSCDRNVVQNIAIADAAMYDAKESGKNQVVVVNADTLEISPSLSSGPTVDQLMAESRGLFEWENDGVLAG